jgi:acyl-CoA synthetase (AMP-forming)/AMP-acid ligase II
MVYTSGSTGKPKGALLTHHGQILTGVVGVERKGLRNRRTICNLPINHVGAVGDICARTLIGGGTVFFHEEFDAARMMTDIEKERLDLFGGPPTIFQICASHPDFARRDLSSVELLAWGGAAMPLDLLRKLKEKTGARLCTVGYGMTETVGGVTFSELEDDDERVVETIGTPDERLPLRIWFDDEGRETDIDEEGEIQVRGDFLMKGYWRRPGATAEAFTEDGWMHTGDLAKRRPDGHLLFTGRMSQMFKSGGYNVYPTEIELCLEEHPDVDIAAVVGVPDPKFQEVGYAYVLSMDDSSVDEETLRAWCKERLANYKVPKRFFVERELPLLPIGKVDKVRLKETATAEAEMTGQSLR